MNGKTAVLVCNGQAPTPELLQYFWNICDFKIGVDGGTQHILDLNHIPDWIIGDLDSLKIPEEFPLKEKIIHVSEQNTNDLHKALRYCVQHEISEVHILGADGKRVDQFLANLEVLFQFRTMLKCQIWTSLERILILNTEFQETLPVGTTVSLLPYFGLVNGVTTSGLKYALTKAKLSSETPPSGVSNLVVESPMSIKIDEGTLVFIAQIQPWEL